MISTTSEAISHVDLRALGLELCVFGTHTATTCVVLGKLLISLKSQFLFT